MTIYKVTCRRFDSEYDEGWTFGAFVNATSKEEAITIYKELSDEYKEHFAEFQKADDVLGLYGREPKSFRIVAHPVKTLN